MRLQHRLQDQLWAPAPTLPVPQVWMGPENLHPKVPGRRRHCRAGRRALRTALQNVFQNSDERCIFRHQTGRPQEANSGLRFISVVRLCWVVLTIVTKGMQSQLPSIRTGVSTRTSPCAHTQTQTHTLEESQCVPMSVVPSVLTDA